MAALAQLATILTAPLAAVPVGINIQNGIKSLSPRRRVEKWDRKVEEIARLVTSLDGVPPDEMTKFVNLVKIYARQKMEYLEMEQNGTYMWFGKGKAKADALVLQARQVVNRGTTASTQQSITRGESQVAAVQPPHPTAALSNTLPNYQQNSPPPMYALPTNEAGQGVTEVAQEAEEAEEGVQFTKDEVEALLYINRSLPMEQNPWESRASLLDFVRSLAVMQPKPPGWQQIS